MVIAPFSFARIPPIHFGPGKLEVLTRQVRQFGSHALLVTGRASLRSSGRLEALLDSFDRAGIRRQILAVDGEPSTELVDSTCARFRGQGLDVVVGIGGGSVIDGAKAVSAMLPHGNSVLDHLEDVGRGVSHSGRKLPFIAVPTTSGTGGEVTKNAVITVVGPNGYKKSLRHDNFIPDAVIVDPDLMRSCPPHVTAACGMDAFTQLLEPFLSPAGSPMTEALAWSGLERIKDNLVPACTDKADDVDTRAQMAYASLLSGVVLANAGLGVVHGLASPIGGFFPIPHGVVCGTLVGAAIRVNVRALERRGKNHGALHKLARVGALFSGRDAGSVRENCRALVRILERWTEELRLPRLGTYGMREADLDRVLDRTSNRNNPVRLEREEIREILLSRL